MTTTQAHKSLVEQYSGGHYEKLSEDSKIFTATAWQQHPAQSFNKLVENVKELNEQWADLIANEGINYFVLAEGDSFCASGFISQTEIACDTEEWYSEIGKSKFITASESFDEEWEELQQLVDQFGYEVCQEVLAVID